MKLKLPRLARARTRPEPAPAAPPPETAEQVLRRLDWTVLQRLDGLMQGEARTLLRGNGMDLADLREYQPHDDVRRIDWNVTARLQVPHVREDLEDRDMTVWFLVDATPSVGFGSQARSKQGLARDFVAVLARVFTRGGHRVGLVVHRGGTHTDEVLPARGGRATVLQLIATLNRPTEPTATPPGLTQLQGFIEACDRRLRRRSTVVVVSDFISTPGWAPALGRLAQRHEVLALRLVDPWERALPDLGLLTLRDAETGEQLMVDLSDPGLRQRFADLAAQRSGELEQQLLTAGVDTLELLTDEDLVAALQRYLALRRLRRRVVAPALPQRQERRA